MLKIKKQVYTYFDKKILVVYLYGEIYDNIFYNL